MFKFMHKILLTVLFVASGSQASAMFINRTTNWAEDRWSFPTSGRGGYFMQTNFGNPYSNLTYQRN
jgi:hypothetical protein